VVLVLTTPLSPWPALGGILVAFCNVVWSRSQVRHSPHALTVHLSHHALAHTWWLTTVYGPQAEQEKIAFLDELKFTQKDFDGPGILCWDFNLTYKVVDKNKVRLNRHLMALFCRVIQELELEELHLDGCYYTWSNKQCNPTLSRIDCVFASVPWCELFLATICMLCPQAALITTLHWFTPTLPLQCRCGSDSKQFGSSFPVSWTLSTKGGM
jgi:hypothetical protein